MQVWEGDEIGLVECWYREDRVSDLLDVYCAREGRLLRVVAFQVYAVLLICDSVCGDRRVMAVDIYLVNDLGKWLTDRIPDLF